MKNTLTHRITSLEQWGMRRHADFQADSVAAVAEAGFTGVLVNGGSGIGPDMLTPESLAVSPVIPDLAPLTARRNQRELNRRLDLLKNGGLAPWLCAWGVPGPDQSAGYVAAESNRFFDRRGRFETHAKLARTPEIFGRRDPKALSWRGSRPLCVSHPLVHEFYADLYERLLGNHPELKGVFFFPGDADPELCHEAFCPRCRATGLGAWGVMIKHVNNVFAACRRVKPDFKFYFTIWNQDRPDGAATIKRILDELDPGIGVCMSMTDNHEDPRKAGSMIFNQPWVNFVKPGNAFLKTVETANASDRPIMVLGEISQAEVWDPVCHNMPNPRKVVELLDNAAKLDGVDAVCDFWGHRPPFASHANLRAMRARLDDPESSVDKILRKAAIAHYDLPPNAANLADSALAIWDRFDRAVDNWALVMWGQRLSYAIGRDGARGFFYQSLVPPNLRRLIDMGRLKGLTRKGIDVDALAVYLEEDRDAFLKVTAEFDALAEQLRDSGLTTGSELAGSEARNVQLAGELIASVGRTFAAANAFQNDDSEKLRRIIETEIDARDRQLEITGRIGRGAGVNPILVEEDVQNMCLYLSRDDFPNTPDDCFQFTPTPYSM